MVVRATVHHWLRVVILFLFAAVAVSPGVAISQTQAPEKIIIGPRGDAELSGSMPGSGPTAQPPVLWEASSNDGVIMGMAISGDVLYFTTKDPGALVAVNRTSGEVLWTADFGADATVFAPAPAGDIVAVGVWVEGANGVVGIDAANGSERWRVSTESLPKTPTLADGTLYVVAEGGLDADAELIAIDPQSGTERWRVQPVGGDFPEIGDQAAVSDGVVVAGAFGFDAASGEQIWAFTGTDSPSFDPVAHGGVALIVDLPTVWAVDLRSGQQIWEHSGVSQGGGIAAFENTAFVGFGGEVRAIDLQSGAAKWSAPVSGIAGAPVVAGGIVYTAVWKPSDDHTSHWLHAFDIASGAEAWSLELEQKVSGNQPLADSGMLYVDTNEAVVAFGSAMPGSGSTGVSTTVAPPGSALAGPGPYTSPEFSYEVSWAEPWQQVQAETSASPGQDLLTLQSSEMILAIYAVSGELTPGQAAQTYLANVQATYPDVEVVEMVESPELSRLTLRYTADGLSISEYVEVRPLDAGGGIVLTLLYGPGDWLPLGYLAAQELVTVDQQPPFRAVPGGMPPPT